MADVDRQCSFVGKLITQGRARDFIQVWLPKPYILALASIHIIFEHFRITLLKFESDTFAHYSHAIHRIYESLCFRIKYIPFSDLRNHFNLSYLKKSHEFIAAAMFTPVFTMADLASEHET